MEKETVEYAMAEAYIKYGTMRESYIAVWDIYPHMGERELMLMWKSIDAYVDLKGE
jgi:hypothetical protein